MDSITVEELKEYIDRGCPHTFLDVREPWEYQICSIAGSINIPMSEIVYRHGEINQSQDIVVICHHGNRSYHVGCFLENNGFERRVINLEGGVDAWANRIDRQMPTY